MKRLLLDTNIYGEMVVDKSVSQVKSLLLNNFQFLIYGSKIIRNELRDTPKKIKSENSNLRIDLLCLYDWVVKSHELVSDAKTKSLSENYFSTYKNLGGGRGKKEMETDFLIVALASIKEMDIVVSDDDASMKSELAMKAYSLVNNIEKLRMPNFLSYFEFKKLLGGMPRG